MSEEWGPWIEHDGRGCPVRGLFVHVVFAWDAVMHPEADRRGQSLSAREWVGVANPIGGGGSWDWATQDCPIIRYRIRKPRALEQLREIAAHPERKRELEDA